MSTHFLGLPDVYLASKNNHIIRTDHSGCTNNMILTQCLVRGFVLGATRSPATLTNGPSAPYIAMADCPSFNTEHMQPLIMLGKDLSRLKLDPEPPLRAVDVDPAAHEGA